MTQFATEIAAVARLRRTLAPVPNIIGPAYGARFCDKGSAVENALFRLELRMADADNVSVSCPLAAAGEEGRELPFPRPARRDLHPYGARRELTVRAGLPPPSEEDWPRSKRKPPLSAAEHFTLGAELKEMHDKLTRMYVALANRRPRTTAQTEATRRSNAPSASSGC